MSSKIKISLYDGSQGKINKRFNRNEQLGRHFYLNDFPPRPVGRFEYRGMIKCKLMHGHGFSFIMPDQIYYKVNKKLYWIQPLHFSPCYLEKDHDFIRGGLSVDISTGEKLFLSFSNLDKIRSFPDGAELFHCMIRGPGNLRAYVTGECMVVQDDLYIRQFHHTREGFARMISDCGYYRYSKWNIRGSKEFLNRGYVYFTCLPSIVCGDDLFQIGMSKDGNLNLIVDNGSLRNPGDIVVLDVYRESCKNRTVSIANFVDVSIVSPQHVYRHRLGSDPAYYEVVMPFIHRISMLRDNVLAIDRGMIKQQSGVHISDHVIVGDASTRVGLIAPFDEEETKEILKIEFISEQSNMLNFWFDHGNMDHFTHKSVDVPSFGC